MGRLYHRSSKKTGLPPGTVVHVGAQKAEPVRINVIDYDTERFSEKQVSSVTKTAPCRESPTVTWINVDGVHDPQVIHKLAETFGIHPLVAEDVASTSQRAKAEDFGDYVFVVLRMIRWDQEKSQIDSEQVSIVLGQNFVITFQEHPGDVFDSVRERIRQSRGRVRSEKADYLAYALIDVIVDNYFAVLEALGERIEMLEGELVNHPSRAMLHELHRLKREVLLLRKSVWPVREIIGVLERAPEILVARSTMPFLRDVYDHSIRVAETIETFRDLLTGMLDIYLSSVGNRSNDIMRILTMMMSIFVPLTFIAGLYGMNFQYMPELSWHWGYYASLGVMAAVALVMLLFFRKRGWI
ncbi:MAG: magnesium/cobalt transporter CorA [Phycisphaerae bacterium]|nr:magnesium/cobalt transporter CorA [Phycisphaerae bacterium]